MDKPRTGDVVIAVRDIIRPLMDTIPEGTALMVTDRMDRKGYDKPGRVGVRVPGTAGLSIGVKLGTDVFMCPLPHEHTIGSDATSDGLDCHPTTD